MTSDDYKRAAAEAALGHVEAGMVLGLGTGSTAEHFVRLLSVRVKAGLAVKGVPTSERTAALARELGVPLLDADTVTAIDLTVDGADEIGPGLALIKGAGGALLREKIIAAGSREMVVIADHTKHVTRLGTFTLPVEVVPFALALTTAAIVRALENQDIHGVVPRLRMAGAAPFKTDGGHLILDCACGRIDDPAALAVRLQAVPGVVEHGLFIGLATLAIIAGPEGVTTLGRA